MKRTLGLSTQSWLTLPITRTRFNNDYWRRQASTGLEFFFEHQNSCDGQGLGVGFWTTACVF